MNQKAIADAVARLPLVGSRFGMLVVVEPGVRHCGKLGCRCLCDCGQEITTRAARLHDGTSQSCGCGRVANGAKRRQGKGVSHGHYAGETSRTARIWKSMKRRCFNANAREFKHYGGRGITVCDRWMKFPDFLADMGEVPTGKSIDRINVNGNYEPGNCRWATAAEQARNRRDTRVTWDVVDSIRNGRLGLIPRKDAAREIGVTVGHVHRIASGDAWATRGPLPKGG